MPLACPHVSRAAAVLPAYDPQNCGASPLCQHRAQWLDVELQEPRQKIIDVETAVQMLQLAMPHDAHLPGFTQFLQDQTEYKSINQDQWTSFWRFAQEVIFLDLYFCIHSVWSRYYSICYTCPSFCPSFGPSLYFLQYPRSLPTCGMYSNHCNTSSIIGAADWDCKLVSIA